MKAITLWPEWAWAICHLGKNVENRTWRPGLKLGERFAIHAGAKFGGRWSRSLRLDLGEVFAPVSSMAERAGIGVEKDWNNRHLIVNFGSESGPKSFRTRDIPVSSIVAIATFNGVLQPGSTEGFFPWWAPDQIGWLIDLVKVLPVPVPCNGKLGLWEIPKRGWETAANQLAL